MSHPTPLQSFLGGVGLTVPIQFLLTLNGKVFGISGFVHNAALGKKDALVSVAGLLLGGAIIGAVEGVGPPKMSVGLAQIALSGLLVGVGTKLSNGCTSGHMLCGISRFSARSIAATTTFFFTAAATTRFAYGNTSPPVASTDWTLGPHGNTFLALQALPFAVSTLVYFFASATPTPVDDTSQTSKPRSILRLVVDFSTAVNFAIALHLSNLNDPNRIISFLLLPFHPAFDPSLAYLAVGAMPAAILLYHFGRGKEQPRLGGRWCVSKKGKIDSKLLLGATIFGVGWGMCGICPGPGLVNLGRALFSGSGIQQTATWAAFVALGGLLTTLVPKL